MCESADYEYWMAGHDPCDEAEWSDVYQKTKSPMTYVFVYGTLLMGEPNHIPYLGACAFTGNALTKRGFLMFDVGFPLVRSPNTNENLWFCGRVSGQVFAVSKHVLDRLDKLEGHPNFYERRLTAIEGHDDKDIFMYHWARQDGTVDGGQVAPDPVTRVIDWKKHLNSRGLKKVS